MVYTNLSVIRRAAFVVAVTVACFVQSSPYAFGQLPLAVGERVKIFSMRDWTDGFVIERRDSKYLIQYTFGRSPSEREFARHEIRRLCEVDAMDYARIWTSSSGEYQVEAALKHTYDDKVILTKTDLTEIVVALENLSSADVAYVTRMKRQIDAAVARGEIPAVIPRLPEVEQFTPIVAGTVVASGPNHVTPLGELPQYLREFRQAGVGFQFSRSNQELVSVIPVGGPEQLVLMATREKDKSPLEPEFHSQLYWVSLRQQRVVNHVCITPDDLALDYNPRTRTLLTFKPTDPFKKMLDLRDLKAAERLGEEMIERFKNFDREKHESLFNQEGTLTVWRLAPGESKVEPLRRWTGSVGAHLDDEGLFAKIISDRVVLAKSGRKRYTAWDLQQNAELYSFRSRTFFESTALVTHDRRHFIFAEDNSINVIEAETGELVFHLPVSAAKISAVNVNAVGDRLVAASAGGLRVWDLRQPDPQAVVYSTSAVDRVSAIRVDWVDDDNILISGQDERVLFRLSLGVPIWSYQMEFEQRDLNRNPLVNHTINGHFIYVARPSPLQPTIAVGAVKLPGPQVDHVVANADLENIYLIRPGTRVGIRTLDVSDPNQVRQWLTEKMETNGWIMDDDAEITFEAIMGQLPPQTDTYRSIGPRGGEFNVTYTPYFAHLALRKGNALLWQVGTSTTSPVWVQGSNIQAQVDQMQRPQLLFFRGVRIPDRILDPNYGNGFGVSRLGLRGIEVVSTSRSQGPEKPADEHPAP